jgi:hypothetical protein
MTNPSFFTGIGDMLETFEKLHTASINSLSSKQYRPIQILGDFAGVLGAMEPSYLKLVAHFFALSGRSRT